LLYFAVKIFFHSILSIFFREVQIVGRDNVPRHGPVIFVVNHANQFVDAVTAIATCEHKISYLMAEASWKRRIIGDIAWALDVVPVKRAQDYSMTGTGTIVLKKFRETLPSKKEDGDDGLSNSPVVQVSGKDTTFTKELKVGDKIRPPQTALAMKITRIESDTQMELDGTGLDEVEFSEEPVKFDILKKIDQKVVYEKVLDKLASGGAIGIFPEGGSHDRTDLLPLKVGVALIAYTAMEKDGLNVPIVPVGLNYFQAHRFRGRAVVEYGQPICIDPKTLSSFKQGGAEKRKVCNELLDRIEDSMKSVLVTTPDYETMQLIHTARRLYQRNYLATSEKQDLTRRFAQGYKMLLLMTEGNEVPKEWEDLQDRLISYQKELTDLGIRDYQVSGLDRKEKYEDINDIDGDKVLREMRLPYQIAHLLFLMTLAAIPAIFLNLPVGLIARLYAERRRKKALARSKVKIRGLDVMLTEKIVLCIVLVPTLWIMYGLLLYNYTNMDGPAIALCFFAMPLFSYMSIIVAEAGMMEFKDLRPYVMRLFPSTRRRLAALPETRRNLQADLRRFIKMLGPALGEVYYGKDLDWKAILSNYRKEKERKESHADLQAPPTGKKDVQDDVATTASKKQQ